MATFVGTGAADTITPTSVSAGVTASPAGSGFGGADLLLGGAGNDTLDGGDGADTLHGGAGADLLIGAGAFADQLWGDGGNDRFDLNGVTNLTGWVILGGSGYDAVDLLQGTVQLGASLPFAEVEEIDTYFTIMLGTANSDYYDFRPYRSWSATFNLPSEVQVRAGAGDDIVYMNDTDLAILQLLPPTDPGPRCNVVLGEAGNDALYGGASVDSLDGGADDDVLDGAGGNDTLRAGDGLDTLYGGAGNDILVASGTGADQMYGGTGNDAIDLNSRTDLTNWVMDGGEGNDVVDFAQGIVQLGTSLTLIAVEVLDTYLTDMRGTGANDLYDLRGMTTFSPGFSLPSEVLLRTGDGADRVFLGDTDLSIIFGHTDPVNGAGYNIVEGGTGADSLTGGASFDSLDGGADADVLEGGAGQDTLRGGTGNDSLTGGIGVDSLLGEEGDDTLNGGDEADTLKGGAGNDLLIGTESLSDVMQGEAGNDGFDLNAVTHLGGWIIDGGTETDTADLAGTLVYLGTTLPFVLVEQLDVLDTVLMGTSGNDNYDFSAITTIAFGGGWRLVVLAGAGNDLVIGTNTGLGAGQFHTLSGGDGNDVIQGGSGADVLLGDTGNDSLRGGAGADQLSGGEGADTLNGGGGADSAFGGGGDDLVYAVIGNDSADGGLGVDTLDTTAFGGAYLVNLATGLTNFAAERFFSFENLISGAGDDTLIGTTAANVITGGAGHDLIQGDAGDDTLIGGAGNDTLQGQAGNDEIFVGANIDQADGGADTDRLILDAVVGRVINLTTGLTDVVGESFVNFENLTGGAGGDTVTGTEGANVILGGAGADSLLGLGGDDRLSGSDGAADTLDGGEGNDTLDGGGGSDRSYGGGGNDVIAAVLGGDQADGGTGIDTLLTEAFTGAYAVNLATGATNYGGESFVNFENLVTGIGQDTLTGSDASNRMDGGGGNDSLMGGAGNDTLIGNAGNDTVQGEAGDDTIVAGAGIDQADGGADRDTLDLSGFATARRVNLGTGVTDTLGESFVNFESLKGGTGDDDLTGSAGNNLIEGGIGADWLAGGEGDDTLLGGFAEADTLNGDAGDDVLNGGGGTDAAFGGAGNDTVFAVLGSDMADGGDDIDTLNTTLYAQDYAVNLTTGLTQYFPESFVNFENLVSGAGNDTLTGTLGANQMAGGAGNDLIDGLAGLDTLDGGAGNDTLTLGASGAVIVEGLGGGIDTVLSLVTFALAADDEIETLAAALATDSGALNLAGNGFAQAILGSAGANVLDDGGGLGVDTLTGLGGDDVYRISQAGAQIIEAVGGGNDAVLTSVSFTLAAGVEIERLATKAAAGTAALTLTGNALAQVIVGNAGDNVLDDGGAGAADRLTGGAGNDTYILANGGDLLIETAGQGNDLVRTSVDFTLAADDDIERLAAFDAAGTTPLALTGNALAQRITGNAGGNILSGGAAGGIDTLVGLGGNDTYRIFNAADIIEEGPGGGGGDMVLAAVSFALAADDAIERMRTILNSATTAIDLTGNGIAQTLTGNAGANRLDGGGLGDTLAGLDGADVFVFSAALGASNVDTITDFVTGQDHIHLQAAIFPTLALGTLAAAAFRANATGLAEVASDRIIVKTGTGELFYDVDGQNGAGGTLFAILSNLSLATNTDFIVL